MEELIQFFFLLSDQTRLRILFLLLDKELCVCEIYAALGMSQPRVSRQLALLKQARIIRDRRDGKWIYYRIDDNDMTEYLLRILAVIPERILEESELDTHELFQKLCCLKKWWVEKETTK